MKKMEHVTVNYLKLFCRKSNYDNMQVLDALQRKKTRCFQTANGTRDSRESRTDFWLSPCSEMDDEW